MVKDDIYAIRLHFTMDSQRQHTSDHYDGGTGFTGRDSTPEALSPYSIKPLTASVSFFRQISFKEIGSRPYNQSHSWHRKWYSYFFSPRQLKCCRNGLATNTEKPTRHRFQPLQLRRTIPRFREHLQTEQVRMLALHGVEH
ncbi:MAG: hypothetical protein Ct9H90mP27_2990 [Gammaproteobacteria bacterium]|nr:MAG: hypothetical protein Ct9H90mP27_2990 [Gammaproteobacteria bacterium]